MEVWVAMCVNLDWGTQGRPPRERVMDYTDSVGSGMPLTSHK